MPIGKRNMYFSFAGHKKTSTTTDIYAHFMPEQDNQASLTIGYALDQTIKSAENVGSKNSKKVARR